jgi:filamentous hemagglutinin
VGGNLDNTVVRPGYTYQSGKNANTAVGASPVSTVVPINAQLPPSLAQQQVNPLSLPGFSLPTGSNGLFRLSGQPAAVAVPAACKAPMLSRRPEHRPGPAPTGPRRRQPAG